MNGEWELVNGAEPITPVVIDVPPFAIHQLLFTSSCYSNTTILSLGTFTL